MVNRKVSDIAWKRENLDERVIRSRITDRDAGKFVAIDSDTGSFEIDADDYTATERLLNRQPHAQIWLCRVGQKTTYRVGGWGAKGGTHTARMG